MSFEHRMQCLRDLRDLGYQVGCGFMVGSPHQTFDVIGHLAQSDVGAVLVAPDGMEYPMKAQGWNND